MRRRRLFVLVVLVAAVVGTVDGTGAVSGTEADRSFSATVTTDARAYLGVERSATVRNDTRTLSVRVTNRLGEDPVRVTVTVDENRTVDTVAPGASRAFEFESVECDDELHVVADSDDVHVDITRPVPCRTSAG